MRTLKISDDLYDQLKNLVVDPFDDTPEAVITRLIEIVHKAKNRWCPFEEEEEDASSELPRHRQTVQEEEPVVVL